MMGAVSEEHKTNLRIHLNKPFGQSRLPLATYQQNKVDLQKIITGKEISVGEDNHFARQKIVVHTQLPRSGKAADIAELEDFHHV
jgi:hypothetical protein